MTRTMILNHYWDKNSPDWFYNHILIQGIANKLRGKAIEVILVFGCRQWTEIKENRRKYNSLTRDLVNLRRGPNENQQQFYEKVIGLLSIKDKAIKHSKKNCFQQQTFSLILAGLRGPLGSTIRVMQMISLSLARQKQHKVPPKGNKPFFIYYLTSLKMSNL